MSAPTPTPDLKTYHGNCHCGAFKFDVQLPELTTVHECNCSHCCRKGYKWVFPGAGCFTITKGEGTLKTYEFGPKSMAHQFCPTCGTSLLGKKHSAPEGMNLAVNARALQDTDVFALDVNKYDGKAIDPQYSPPHFTGPEPTAKFADAKTYYGSCHCGAVTLAMKTDGPLPDGKQTILQCDCSICTHNGWILTYPKPDQLSITNDSALSSYSFGREFNVHKFCPTCGVSVYIHKKEDIPKENWTRWKGEQDPKSWTQRVPVNLLAFEGVEWDALKQSNVIKRVEGAKVEPVYVVPE